MIIPKLVSSQAAVEKFYSYTGTSNELQDDDIRLWVSEVFDLMPYYLQYIPKVIGHKQDPDYDFTNFTVPLPCDFYKLMPGGLAVDGNPVRWRQNAFHYLMSGDCCNVDNLNNTAISTFVDQFGNEFSPNISTDSLASISNLYRDVTFDITDGKIVFNTQSGKVCMAYWSYPVDNQGYLLIPDSAKYQRAVADYLIWRNDYILWRQQSISDKVYEESKRNKDWSIASAMSEMKIPDVEQIESMKNSIIRLLPRFNSYNHFFKDLGVQESRRMR